MDLVGLGPALLGGTGALPMHRARKLPPA